MLSSVKCRFGDSRFSVISDDNIAEQFYNEFSCSDNDVVEEIRFYIARPSRLEYQDIRDAFFRNISLQKGYFTYEDEFAVFYIGKQRLDDVLIEVKDSTRRKLARKTPLWMQRLLSNKYISVDEIEFGHIIYGAIIWLLFIQQVSRNNIILHASSVCTDVGTFALCGDGGVGKTSLSGWLIKNKSSKFLSDDLLPVRENATALPSGLFVHVYPYNEMEDALWQRSISMRRLHWMFRKVLLGPKRVCARLSPKSVYPEIHNSPVRLDAIVWLSRADSPPQLQSANAADFVEDHLRVLRHEMRRAFRFVEEMSNQPVVATAFPLGFAEHVKLCLESVATKTRVLKFTGSSSKNISQNGRVLEMSLATSLAREQLDPVVSDRRTT